MKGVSIRKWMVRWMYGVAAAHLLVGILLPWIGDLAFLDGYHRSVETGFWGTEAPLAARAQQIWWVSLFGPTVQSMSIWMGMLTYFGDRYRNSIAWMSLIIGLAVWAPQDMWISLKVGAWIHVWVDCFALAVMLPPLIWLWRYDRKNSGIAQSE